MTPDISFSSPLLEARPRWILAAPLPQRKSENGFQVPDPPLRKPQKAQAPKKLDRVCAKYQSPVSPKEEPEPAKPAQRNKRDEKILRKRHEPMPPHPSKKKVKYAQVAEFNSE